MALPSPGQLGVVFLRLRFVQGSSDSFRGVEGAAQVRGHGPIHALIYSTDGFPVVRYILDLFQVLAE